MKNDQKVFHFTWIPPVSRNRKVCVVSDASATGKIDELFIDAVARLKRDAVFAEVEVGQRRHKLTFKVDSIAQNNTVAAINRCDVYGRYLVNLQGVMAMHWRMQNSHAMHKKYLSKTVRNSHAIQCDAQKSI